MYKARYNDKNIYIMSAEIYRLIYFGNDEIVKVIVRYHNVTTTLFCLIVVMHGNPIGNEICCCFLYKNKTDVCPHLLFIYLY